jgi:hypothetical protein
MVNRRTLYVLALLLAAAPGLDASGALHAAEKPPQPAVAREIYVPFEQLDVLLEGPTRRVLLSRSEYDELLKQARHTPDDAAPRKALLLAADYELKIDNQRAEITARLTCEVLADGLHALPLVLERVGIRQAALDGRPASLGSGDGGRPTLFVSGRGRHEATLLLVTPLETNAAQQMLNVRLPRLPASRLRVTVPGNVEVRSGADVIRREVDEAAGVTRLELVPVDGSLSLAMSLNNRRRGRQRVVVARSVLVDEVTSAYERLHATVSLGVLHQAVDHFRFALPEGFEVADVQSPALARWSTTAEGNRKILEVALRQETTDTVVLNIAAVRTPPRLDAWKFPDLEPLDVAGRVSVVGLLLEDRLRAEDVTAAGLLPIDTTVLAQALPAGVFAAEPGAPRIRSIVSYYSPDGAIELSARFVRPESRLRATSNVLLTLRDRGLEVRGGFALAPEAEALHEFDFTVPPGWQVAGVTGADGANLPYERYGNADEAGRIHVRLPHKIAVGSPQSVFFRATQTPTGWLDDWTTEHVEFPKFAIAGAAVDVGAVAVAAEDDLAVRPDVLTNLTPLGAAEKPQYGLAATATQSAYRYDAPDYRAAFVVERNAPRVTARTFSFLRVEPEVLTAHYELIFDVAQARARRLSFTLPASTPANVAVRALDGRTLKEYGSELVDGGRRWTALLAEGAQGSLRLAVDFQQPLPAEEVHDFAVPIVHADDVAYQSGIVAVEGSAELDVQVAKFPRKVDVGELVDAEYQTGRRLLGAYGFIGDDPLVTIDVVRHPQYVLQPALVQQAQYVTLLGTNGRAQTSADLKLRTKVGFLEVKLPPGSTLWSAVLDGRPAQPQREGDSLLLSFPSSAGEALRSLVIVYETPIARLSACGRVEVPALSLFLRTAAGTTSTEVPTADVRWTLHLPPGYGLLQSRGSVAPPDVAHVPQLAATRVAEFLVQATGGFGEQIYYARHAARGTARRAASALSSSSYELSDRDADRKEVDRLSEGRMEVAASDKQVDGLKRQREALSKSMPESAATPAPAAAPAAAIPPPASPAPEAKPAEAAKSLRGMQAIAGKGESTGEKRPAAKLGLAGVRSLKIDLQATDDVVVFQSLGVAPRLDVTLVDRRRADALAWALALAVVLYGLWLTQETRRRKFRFLVGVALAATLLPLVTGWFALIEIVNPSFYAACALVPYYVIAAVARRLGRRIRQVPRVATAGAAATLVLAIVAHATPSAELAAAEPAAKSAPVVVQIAPPAPPVKVPDDALILLYEPTKEPGVPKVEQLLVPYDRYQQLWNRAHPDEHSAVRPPPQSYAPAGATFTAMLSGDDSLRIDGRLEFDLFVDDFVQIPLPLTGGVLESARLDGKQAKLNVVRPETAAEAKSKPARPAAEPAALLVLVAAGKGRHQLELSIRLGLQKVGGWRAAEGRLPANGAAGLTLTVPQSATEVRLTGLPDRRNYTTTRAGETIATALGADGAVRIEWRPKVNQLQVDETLKARSEAVLAVQEDGLRLAWRTSLEFSQVQRESFSVIVPPDYLVERVAGDNIRGWEPRDDAGRRKLDITLLQPTATSEQFTVYLSQRRKLGDAPSDFTVPVVGVDGAAVHSGQITLRRSRALDLRTIETTALTRIDLAAEADKMAASAEAADVSPLGMRVYQSYRFATSSFVLKLAVEPAATRTTAELHTILRVAERERRLESQLALQVQGTPLHQLQVYLPDDLELEQVAAPGTFEWAVTPQANRRVLSIYFAAGQTGSVNVVLAGALGKPGPLDVVPLPRLELLDVERQQGDLVVQVDPAYDVAATDLRGCERELLNRTFGWLTAAQRPLARLALRHSSGDYGGTLRLTARKPVVSCRTVTNVRVTDRTVEETILLDFTIRNAGVREVAFLLPAELRDARIDVPQLRQRTIEPVGDDGRRIRVRLQLQDEVMNQLRVLVQHDRARATKVAEAPLPTIETGQTDGRFVALESSGRDEVTVGEAIGLEPLSRRQQQWQIIAGLLGGGSTQAFRVEPNAADPRLTYEARTRTAVETVGARIGLAETTLVFDASGAYRAVQSYRMDNKTEQFLVVELPAGAELWTAWAAGEPVKPTRAPPPASAREVRIPLVKTAEGDLDYEVRLIYGGKVDDLATLRRVSFPLMRTVNVKVELSQVRLYLPESYRWLNFGGTMKRVFDEADLQAGNLAYYNKSAEKLAQTLERGDEFAKVRASNSLQMLKSDVQSYVAGNITVSGGNANLQQELVNNGRVWQAAEQQRQAQVAQQPTSTAPGRGLAIVSNNEALNNAYTLQSNARSLNVASTLTSNFSHAGNGTLTLNGGLTINSTGQFDAGWFRGNGLANDAPQSTLGDNRLQQAQPQQQGGEQILFGGLGNRPVAPNMAGAKDESSTIDALAAKQPSKMNPQADVVQRYQQRLEEKAKKADDFNNFSDQQARTARVDVGAANVYVGGTTIAGGTMLVTNGIAPAKPDAAGLVGLDAQIPQRGVLYRFTTPLGEPDVTAVPVSTPLVESLQRLLVVLVALVVLRIVWRLWAAGRVTAFLVSRTGALALVLAGLASMVLWMLPLVGLMLIVAGLVLLARTLFVRTVRA